MIEKNIEAATKAAQALERKLCDEDFSMTPEKIIGNCKKMVDFINAANLMNQIKAAQNPPIIKKGLFKL